MDEYLFFQKNKAYLKDNTSILSPRLLTSPLGDRRDDDSVDRNTSVRNSLPNKVSFLAAPEPKKSTFMPRPQPDPYPKFDKNGLPIFPPEVELNDETMEDCLKDLSSQYSQQYISSGYPPKVCSLILKELIKTNKLKCQILDIGCGKGEVGEYLRQEGFLHITGMDCSRSLLQIAQSKKAYEKLEKCVFGQEKLDESHNEKYDVVISSSMINNDGWDRSAFQELLDYTKMGGFVIFTTKLNLNQEDQYAEHIKKLNTEQHWRFVTNHSFYRYDKLCGGQGKFSNKMVKIYAYQKTDHNEYLIREKDRLEEEAIEFQRKQEEIARKIREKEEKLNKNANDRAAKKRAMQKQMDDEKNAELMAEQELQQTEEEKILQAEKAKQRKEQMMKKLKTFIENAMWIKLKALKKKEEERIEALRVEAEKKRKAAVLARKQTILMKKVPYDSDDEGAVEKFSPGIRAKQHLLDQKHPA